MQERPERWLEFYEDIRHRGSLRVTVNGTEYGEEDIVSCKVDRHLSDSGPSAGNACAACLTLRIIPNDPIPRAACVRLYYRLELKSDVTKYLPKGTFFVNRRKQDGRVVELECYDSMLKSEQDFLTEETTDDWPKSASDVVDEIAARMGLTADSRNMDLSPSRYDVGMPAGLTMREVLQDIAARAGGNWCVSPMDTLRLVPVKGIGDTVASVTGRPSEYTPMTISGVRLWADSESYWPSPSPLPDGDILDATATDATPEGAATLFANVSGTVYRPYESEGRHIDPACELGDTVPIGGVEFLAWSMVEHIGPSYTADLSAPAEDSEVEDEYPFLTQAERLNKRVGKLATSVSSISKNQDEIVLRVETVEEESQNLEDATSEHSTKLSELSLSLEGFKTEVQETVSSQNEKIGTVESNYSSLSQTVSGLSSTVSSVKTTANNAASKADSAAAKANSALSDAKNYTDGQLETVKGELSAEIEQTPSRIQLSVERSGYFSVFEGTSWTNYTAGTFGNKITVNGVSGTAARLSTTDPDTLTYARGNTLHGSLSYRILTAIKGKSSSASFRFFLGVKYTDDTYTINDIIYGQGNKTIATAGSKTTVSLDVSVSEKEISLIYLEVSASSCSGVIEVGEVWANVAELNGKASTLTLTADGAKFSSANIVMKGAVSFEDLSGAGRTTINGANVTTGIIRNAAGTTEYNLDSGTIRMGGSSGNRVYIDSDKIEWYGGNASGGGTGAGTIRNGLTTGTAGDTCVIGADTRYQKYGWYHGGNFQGITVEQVDNEVSVSGKLSVNQAVSCRTLKAWDAKERVVRTPLGNLQMNAMESPEPLFWDVGSGVCDSTGVCWIALRPEYAETISRRTALRWVVTPTGGPGSLWVEKLDTGAMVHGGAGQRFDWMCAGVQRGFEGCYAEGDPGRYPVPENPGDWFLTAAIDEAAVDLPLTI